jgi:hypothetical protein
VPAGAPWLKVSEPIDYLRAVRPKVAVPVHDQVLSAAGRAVHYRQLEQLGAKGARPCGRWMMAPRRSYRCQRASAVGASYSGVVPSCEFIPNPSRLTWTDMRVRPAGFHSDQPARNASLGDHPPSRCTCTVAACAEWWSAGL